MKCPNCDSDYTQRLEVIYHGGTQQYSGTGRVQGGGTVGVHGVSQTALAQAAAPPAKRGLFGPILAVAAGLGVASSVSGFGPLLGWAIAAIATFLLVTRWFYNRMSWPGDYKLWLEGWGCLQCGRQFFPKVSSTPSAGVTGGPDVFDVMMVIVVLATGVYFTRSFWQPYLGMGVPAVTAPRAQASPRPGAPPSIVSVANIGRLPDTGSSASDATASVAQVTSEDLPLYKANDRRAAVLKVLPRGTQVQRSDAPPSALDRMHVLPPTLLVRVVSPTGNVGWVDAKGLSSGSQNGQP